MVATKRALGRGGQAPLRGCAERGIFLEAPLPTTFRHGEREVYVAVGPRCPFASAAEEHDRLDLGCPLGPVDDRIPLFLCELHVTTIAPN
jgi:hypothetical protein